MTRAYYNEIDPAAAHILRAMIDADVIAPGDVDTRSIKEVMPDDVRGYTQCHFFAGGGLWSVAARLAGWPDDRPLWTGSCPCQPFSAAGKGLGTDDPRHLWPDFHRLIRACRPAVVMGEQVAGKAGYGWFDGVRSDLEGEGYSSRAVDFPACSVDAPHQRNRLYWIAVEHTASERRGKGRPEYELWGGWPTPAGANASGVTQGDAFGSRLEGQRKDGDGGGRQEQGRPVAASDGAIAASFPPDANGHRCDGQGIPEGQERECRNGDAGHHEGVLPDADRGGRTGRQESEVGQAFERTASERPLLRNGSWWSDSEWIISPLDGKARRAKPGIRFLVDGLPGRVDLWRIGGNAIVPQAAAEVIAAFMETVGLPVNMGRSAA